MNKVLVKGISIFTRTIDLDLNQQRAVLDSYFQHEKGFETIFRKELNSAVNNTCFPWGKLAVEAKLFENGDLCDDFFIRELVKLAIHSYLFPENYYSEKKLIQYLDAVVFELSNYFKLVWVDSEVIVSHMRKYEGWMDAEYFYSSYLIKYKRRCLDFRFPMRHPCDAGEFRVKNGVDVWGKPPQESLSS